MFPPSLSGIFYFYYRDPHYLLYFSDYKMHRSPQIWEERGGASCRPNVAYLAHWGGGLGGAWQWWSGIFFSYFPLLKPKYILWSSVCYSPTNTIIVEDFIFTLIFNRTLHFPGYGTKLRTVNFAQLVEENRWKLNPGLLVFNLELVLYFSYYKKINTGVGKSRFTIVWKIKQ